MTHLIDDLEPNSAVTGLGQAVRCGAYALLLLSTPALSLERGTVIEGPARVIDGDTVEVSGTRVRLNGVAAPELSEPGGPEASTELRRVIGERWVRCALNGERTRSREVGMGFPYHFSRKYR